MAESEPIIINAEVSIPESELSFRASRSGGPGGQHVNTSSTRIELLWDVANSASLTEAQRTRIQRKLANRINAEGVLLLADSGSRSQHQNRRTVVQRFAELLTEALHRPKPRKKTRPTKASRERRLRAKKRRSELKRSRGSVRRDE